VDPKTYIAITFWGENYRRYFLDYCLASLMASENIPAIANKSDARLLIATRSDDWDAIQSDPVFISAKDHITIEHIPHEVPVNPPYDRKMFLMSDGHKLLTRRMFQDRACGVIVFPDFVFANGAIKRIEQLHADGNKVVMCLCVRFANEGLLADLRCRYPVGQPINVSAQELASLAIKNMHSETARLDFDAAKSDRGGVSFFWTVTPGQNVLFHACNWQPILIDYASLSVHDTSTFDNWTIDGDYITKNFPDVHDIYVVTDTTELFFCNFATESSVSFSKKAFLPYQLPFLRRALKILRARECLERFGILDSVKKYCFRVPIRVQGGPASDADWCETERRAGAVIDQVMQQGGVGFVVFYRFLSFIRLAMWVIRSRFLQKAM
jgi:hypothetical protein